MRLGIGVSLDNMNLSGLANPTASVTGLVSGVARNATALTAVLTNEVASSWQWLLNDVAISGAITATYTPTVGTDSVADDDEISVRINGSYTSNSYNVRYAPGSAAGALADQSFVENTGAQTFATAGDFTLTNLTGTYSVNVIAGVSINSSTGVVSFATDTMSVQAGTSIVVTFTDQYSRTITSAFSLAITAAPSDTTDPVFNSSSYNSATRTISVNITEANPSRVYWALVANPSTPTAAQIKAGTGGGILDAGDYAYSDGANSDVITVTNETGDEIHMVATDTAGNGDTVEIITGVVVDSTIPTLSSSSPVDNATDFSTTANPTLTFSENVAFGTGNITLRENNGGWADLEAFDVATEVGTSAGQVNIVGAVLTVYPTADLVAGREYAIRIDATAIDDTHANSYAGIADDTTLSFTAVAVPWVPADDATLYATAIAHFDAEASGSITVTSSPDVDQLDDQTSNGYNVAQSTASNKPHTGVTFTNGNNGIEFDGTDDRLDNTAVANYGTGAIDGFMIAVVKLRSGYSNNGVLSQIGTNNAGGTLGVSQGGSPSTAQEITARYTNGYVENGVTWAADDEAIFTLSRPAGGDHSDTAMRYDGSDTTENNNNTNAINFVSGNQTITIGTDIGGTDLGKFVLGELIYMDATPSAANIEKLEGYLAHKWGLEGNLPGGHTYKSSAP